MKRLEGIKNILEDKLTELTSRVENIEEDLRAPHDDDWSEDASESQHDEAQGNVENMANEEIKKIKLALAKIKDGSYGKCQECGKEISSKRLEAIPYAAKCVSYIDEK